ncbi:hypothetical protein AKJ16_DCAP08838 [Drosera capensis]
MLEICEGIRILVIAYAMLETRESFIGCLDMRTRKNGLGIISVLAFSSVIEASSVTSLFCLSFSLIVILVQYPFSFTNRRLKGFAFVKTTRGFKQHHQRELLKGQVFEYTWHLYANHWAFALLASCYACPFCDRS